MDSSSGIIPVKAFSEERMAIVAISLTFPVADRNMGKAGKLHADGLPGAYILVVFSAGKLGYPKVTGFVADIGLRPGATQGTSRSKQHAQPSTFVGGVVRFQLKGCIFQITDGGPWRCCHGRIVVEKCAIWIQFETQSAHPTVVEHSQKIVGFPKRSGSTALCACPFPFSPFQQRLSPPVRCRIEEDTKIRFPLRNILRSWK